jgi:hypothetical protein
MAFGCTVLLPPITLSRGAEQQHRPQQKSTKQQHFGQVAVGQQMAQRPDLDRQGHGVAQFGPDVVFRHIGADQQHHGQPHQQDGGVLHASGG